MLTLEFKNIQWKTLSYLIQNKPFWLRLFLENNWAVFPAHRVKRPIWLYGIQYCDFKIRFELVFHENTVSLFEPTLLRF